MATPKAAQVLKNLKAESRTVEKEPSKSKTQEVPFKANSVEGKDIIRVCETGAVVELLEPILKRGKEDVKKHLISLYAEQLWENRTKPASMHAFVTKAGKGTSDMSLTYTVKFNPKGLVKIVDASKDKSLMPQEVVFNHLVGELGLDEAKAKTFTQKEIQAFDISEFAMSFEAMLSAAPGTLYRRLGEKLLGYIGGEPPKSGTMVRIEALTDDERSAILVTRKIVLLKEGLLDRICDYCENKEELELLLMAVDVGQSVGSIAFAESDDRPERNKRMLAVVDRYIVETEKAEKSE